MKYTVLAYPLISAALCICACTAPSLPTEEKTEKKAEIKTPAKPLTPAQKAIQENRRKWQESWQRQKALNQLVRSIQYNKAMNYAQRIQLMKDELKKPDHAADPTMRLLINEQIITYCRMPSWTMIQCYDPAVADVELVPAAMAIINDKEINDLRKVKTYSFLAEYYAGLKDFKKAEEVARKARTLQIPDKSYHAKAYLILADVYRWNEDYPNFRKAVMDAIKIDPATAATHGAGIALRYGKTEDAASFWKAAKNPYAELCFYSGYNLKYPERVKGMPLFDRTADARKFVLDEKNPANQRFDIAARYCMEGMDAEDIAVRATLKNIPVKAKNSWAFARNGGFTMAYARGGYALAAELCELVMDTAYMAPLNAKFIYISSLGAIGRTADAIRYAEKCLEDTKLSPVDRTKIRSFIALLEGRDVMAVIKEAKLTNKEEYGIVRSVARQCMVWGKMADAEKYAAEYQKYFIVPEKRVLRVKYFDDPIYSVSDWRKVYRRLEKQYCNIPYRGALDFFETDVATGTRNVTFDPTEKPLGTTEITAAADRYGLHVFLRIEDENAREVEQGFAKAVSPECYFAPGHNQPYICFGPDPVSKSAWTFHTAYNNKGSARLDEKQPARSYRIDYAFSDTDYVIHLFFGWETHYNKLPENGSEYLFEAIVWTPGGGMTWGGSQGPHGVSDWGRLRFELTKKQLNEIRREIIFKTFRNYKKVNFGGVGGMGEDVFMVWGTDVIGEPAFHQKYLKGLQEKLEKYAKLVKKDMTDEDVENVYVNALIPMKGLRYEVEELRRKYLEETLMQ